MAAEHPIELFHAHVYFDAPEMAAAETLCRAAAERLDLKMGRLHADPIGPHPRGSCQLTVPVDKFAETIAWLMMNRGDHTIFVHAITGNDWLDHTQAVMWLGPSDVLNLDVFRKKEGA